MARHWHLLKEAATGVPATGISRSLMFCVHNQSSRRHIVEDLSTQPRTVVKGQPFTWLIGHISLGVLVRDDVNTCSHLL